MKKLLILLLTAIISFGFIACNPDVPKTETSESTGTIPTISSPQDVISIIEIIQHLFGDKAEEYTITYYDQGGSDFSGTHATGHPTTHTSGKDTTLLGATKNGYIFDGWFTDSDCSGTAVTKLGADDYTEDITLYAKWTADSFSITYKDKDGSAFSGTHATGHPTTHTYGTKTTLLSATKDGYEFGGWFTASDCTGTAITELGATAYTSDITLYAKWIPVYSITYKDMGGDSCSATTNTSPTTHTYGTKTTLVDPSKTNYLFCGWFDDTNCTGFPITELGATDYSSNITLYAKWIKVENTAHLEPEYKTTEPKDGISKMESKNITSSGKVIIIDFSYDEAVTLSAGWYYVSGTANFSKTVTCSGDVHIILADNCNFTVTGEENKAGINITGSNKLTIYAQSQGDSKGKLTVTGGKAGAGIGGGKAEAGNNIILNGGNIIANAGIGCGAENDFCGAAIGGGGDDGEKGSNIIINDGVIIAKGVGRGAGIGGGRNRNGENIIINGGTVTATGGSNGGAGIGGALGGEGNYITINGGTVTATGGNNKFFGGAAGIGGGGNNKTCSNININGGTVTATGGSSSAFGIGGGSGDSGSNIYVSGDYQICAGDSANPTAEVTHDSETDLSNSDNFKKQYVVIKQKTPI